MSTDQNFSVCGYFRKFENEANVVYWIIVIAILFATTCDELNDLLINIFALRYQFLISLISIVGRLEWLIFTLLLVRLELHIYCRSACVNKYSTRFYQTYENTMNLWYRFSFFGYKYWSIFHCVLICSVYSSAFWGIDNTSYHSSLWYD